MSSYSHLSAWTYAPSSTCAATRAPRPSRNTHASGLTRRTRLIVCWVEREFRFVTSSSPTTVAVSQSRLVLVALTAIALAGLVWLAWPRAADADLRYALAQLQRAPVPVKVV